MYAIVKRDGRQYKVATGDIVLFDKMSLESKAKVELADVLAIHDGKSLKIGTPMISGAKVEGEVINEGRGEKVITFKKRRRKDSKQKIGFKRDFTRVRITNIAG